MRQNKPYNRLKQKNIVDMRLPMMLTHTHVSCRYQMLRVRSKKVRSGVNNMPISEYRQSNVLISVSHYSLMSSDRICNFDIIIFTIVNCFTGHPVNFVEHHSMGVPMVLCHHRLHPHSEWSSMRSGAKGIGNVLWGPFGCYRWLPNDGRFPFLANLSLAGLIYNNLSESM